MSASTATAARSSPTAPTGSTVLFYGLPGLITAIPIIPVFTLLPAYYAGTVGLGLAVTGAVLFASRVIDVVTDPLVGRLTDHAGTAMLRRLVGLGALLAAPALVLLLDPPAQAGWPWLLLTSVALYLGWTLVQVPYLTWGATLSRDYHQRTRLTASREGAVLVGVLLSGALPAALGMLGYGTGGSLALMGWLAVLLGIPAFWLLLTRVPDPVTHPPASSGWRGIQRNRLFLRLLGAWFVNGIANGLPAVLFPLYCAHVLDVPDDVRNLLLALYFVCGVAGVPLWLALSRRLSKHRAWSCAMLVACPAFAVAAMLEPGQVAAFAAVCVVTGLCLGADMVLPPAIQADVADWDRLRYRRNRTAGLFSLWNMSTKLSLALAAGVALPLLGVLGLEAAPPTPESLLGLALIYALVPCVLKVGAVLMMLHMPLTPAAHRAVSRRLERRQHVLAAA